MSSTSPRISDEPQPLKAHVFTKKASVFDSPPLSSPTSLSGSLKGLSPMKIPSSLEDKEDINNTNNNCTCPHVLIAEDDPLQAFYYQHLFLKSMSFDDLIVEKENFRLQMFSSGEELIDSYSRLIKNKCHCNSLLLIITDYNMGPKRLNGVDTILALRKEGYKGPAILRTGETKEDLCQLHADFEVLLKEKFIDALLDKSDHLRTKSVVCDALRRKNVF